MFLFLSVNDLSPEVTSDSTLTNQPPKITRRDSLSSRSSLSSLPTSWSNYGPIDNFVARPFSSSDKKKFYLLLLRITISCGFSLSWINNKEVIEFFRFLRSQIKLQDRKTI